MTPAVYGYPLLRVDERAIDEIARRVVYYLDRERPYWR